MARVAPSAEEPREHVERIIGTAARAAALAVLLDAVVAVLVVDLAQGGRRQNIIGIRDLDKLLARSFVATSTEEGNSQYQLLRWPQAEQNTGTK